MCAPATTGTHTGTLTLQHDAGAPVSMGLTCNAFAGQLEVVEPLNTMVLYGSQWGRATIHNTGVGPLHINNLTASGLSIRGITLP
ncbi:hypothetical protein, partial [Hyalangium sp.]|uniref:hypothetical protein n=1 Tax=Hyalangium sp. TaxID=2028555 RepID=UPI002D27ABA0